jgi:hypothetical protein
MANRSNEFRKADGYLHVLSTEHVKMSNGALNPCKIRINNTIPDGAKNTIVDNNNSVSFFTLTNHDLIEYSNNLTRQIETLNKSIETLKENKDTSEESMWHMLAVGIVSLVVCLVCAAITQGQSTQIAEAETNSQGQVVHTVEQNRHIVTDVRFNSYNFEIGGTTTRILNGGLHVQLGSWSLLPMELMFYSEAMFIIIAPFFGISLYNYRTYSDSVNKEDLLRSFDDAVLNCVSMEAAFRADNKVIVDPN